MRRIAYGLLLLTLTVLVLAGWGRRAGAEALDPAEFTSLGANPFTTSGTYTIDTGATPPVLTTPDDTSITGVVFDPTPLAAGDEIAVFTFDSIAIGSDITVQATGSRPLAVLSQGGVTISADASVDVSGAGGSGFSGGGGGGGGRVAIASGAGGFTNTGSVGVAGGHGGSAGFSGGEAGSDGVVTTTTLPVDPFAAFTAKVDLTLGPSARKDVFDLTGTFTLAACNNGIVPPLEEVSLTLAGGTGSVTVSIPEGSFMATGKGAFLFEGTVDGVALEVRIAPIGTKQYSIQAQGTGAALTGFANPVTVTLTIGDDRGTTSVTADMP